MTSCYPTILPVKVDFTYIIDQERDYQQADFIIYQQLIDKFIYLSYKTRPDIAFIVG